MAQILAAAVQCHRAGAMAEAERHYRTILAMERDHAVALQNLGILAIQTGRQELAADVLSRAISLNRRSADLHYNRAVALEALGHFDDAAVHYREAVALKPDYAEAHLNLGNVLTCAGRIEEALVSYQRVLALQPQSAVAHYNIANVLASRGARDTARTHYHKALAIEPGFAEAHNNLANTLRDGGSLAEAEVEYRRALALKPSYADAHNNLGTVLAMRSAIEGAIAHFRQALQARPDFVDAHHNLGLALFGLGRREEAIAHVEKAIALESDNLEAHLTLARQFYATGAVDEAAAVAARALAISATPDTRDLLARYVGALRDAALAEPHREFVGNALREGWTRTGALDGIAAGLIKRTPSMVDVLARCAGPAREPRVCSRQDLAALAAEPLLRNLMIVGPVRDRELESLLTSARRGLLAAASDEHAGAGPEMLDFACALAWQCFVNEYVFAETAAERGAAQKIADAIAGRIRADAEFPAFWLAVVAAYTPLRVLPQASLLLGREWPTQILDLLVQQIREPCEEQAIRAALPVLTAIDDEVSRRVRTQYEENPYPRWIAPSPAVPARPLDQYIGMKFPRAPLRALSAGGGADILIAGCGTGAHAIDTCRRIAGARVLAIDLSAASLAYAVRKTRKLGLAIEYAQADLLRLGGIGKTFDLIEASGVLHHLADPMLGWRILLSLLKPGGIMAIGLYSRLARADVSASRTLIAARNYRPTAEDIRRCRQDLLALPPSEPAHGVTRSGDFYSTSGCRDLLFHVQEHQHTLPEIAAFLTEQNLQFLGFEIDPRVLTLYVEQNPDDPAMTDLAAWHRFETQQPGIFKGMYQFMVQKP